MGLYSPNLKLELIYTSTFIMFNFIKIGLTLWFGVKNCQNRITNKKVMDYYGYKYETKAPIKLTQTIRRV